MTDCDHDFVPPLLCLIYAEFDARVGPRIVYQVPVEIVTKELFDSLSAFLIPRSELVDRLIKVDLPSLKIMGYPKAIENNKYERNAFIFNLCFVVANVAEVDFVYEPLVEKLAKSLEAFELECSFLSDESSRASLKPIMLQILSDLNSNGRSSIVVNEKCEVHLKLMRFHSSVSPTLEWMAPALRRPVDASDMIRCDLVLQKLLPHINGFDTVARISATARVDLAITKRCLRDAMRDDLICLHPVFQYGSHYAVTPLVRKLYKDKSLQEQFCRSVAMDSQQSPVRFVDLFRLLNSIQAHMSIKEWYVRSLPRSYGVDERKLVQMAVCHGMLRKLSGYPLLTDGRKAKIPAILFRTDASDFDGTVTLEQLAVKAQLPYGEVVRLLSKVSSISIVWK
ncbi:nitrogen permease regulator 2 [Trichuris suis]|nr:nitrogen permease regulator 2 [Trichuris suis]